MSLVRRGRLLSEMNVVPYIDVMLVLLIIFMIIAPLLVQGIPIELPQAQAQNGALGDTEPLVLSIDEAGALYLNVGDEPEQPIDEDAVVERASAAVRRNPNVPAFVRADIAVTHGRVVRALSLLRAAGVESPWIAVNPLDGQ